MTPKFRPVKFVWKFPRPQEDHKAQALLKAAYITAMATDPETVVILIRSEGHPTTYCVETSKYVADRPHITIACKNPEQVLSGTHLTSHGYTVSQFNLEIIEVRANEYGEMQDDMFDGKRRRGHERRSLWPDDLPEEEIWLPIEG
ncbi:MAG: hypothetical protein L6R40_007458 [Gallowayella cf. fulva]|nr:MAG: hypothetical protein L6R40_007458 [Xanthomendoza cf. fulva]